MKHLIIYLLLVVPGSFGFCQGHDSLSPESQESSKIKKDKKLAWMFLGVGTASSTAAAIIESQKADNKMGALNYVGFVSTLMSVALFSEASPG